MSRRTVLLVSGLSVLVILLVFFLAPVIPYRTFSYSSSSFNPPKPCAMSSVPPTFHFYRMTLWGTPSLGLLGFGYYFIPMSHSFRFVRNMAC